MKKWKDPRINTFFSEKEYQLIFLIFLVMIVSTGFLLLLYRGLLVGREILELNRRLALTVYFVILTASITGVTIYIRFITFGHPLNELGQTARKIANGDFSVRFASLRKDGKKDSLEVLIEDFNIMAEELENLEKRTAERKKELELLTEEAMTARKRAEEASKSKSLFLANMSHEIRTPMNAIIGMSELLLCEELNDRQMQYVNDIKNASTTLLEIINDILDLSKIESNKFELAPEHYNFNELLKNIHTMLTFIARKKNIEFLLETDGEIPQYLYGDDIRLRQILINICGNAIKFTNEGFVCLKVSTKNDVVIFKIEDTGIGIPEENLNSIFNPFEQADTGANRAIKGTGLGLSISKQLVELMDGSIGVESIYGEGSVFTITIPKNIGNVEMIKPKEKRLEKFTAPSCKILIVDDNEINLEVAKGILELFEISADIALSGLKAIELIKRKRYDIVFMDHMMPGMDGVETTKTIREWEKNQLLETADTPIIALTANSLSGVKEMFLTNGFNDFLSKPLEIAKLTDILLKWLPADKIHDKAETVERDKNAHQTPGFLDMLSNISYINIQTGMYYFSGMEDMYQLALNSVYSTTIAECEKMKKFLDEENITDFAIKVHGMKSCLLNVGITDLSALAGELERAAKQGDLQFCQSHFPSFYKQMKDLNEQLEDVFAI